MRLPSAQHCHWQAVWRKHVSHAGPEGRVETPAQKVVKVHIIASEILVASMPGPQLTVMTANVRHHKLRAIALSRAQARAGS